MNLSRLREMLIVVEEIESRVAIVDNALDFAVNPIAVYEWLEDTAKELKEQLHAEEEKLLASTRPR